MHNYQVININENSFSFNDENKNLKSSNQIIVIKDNKYNYIESFDWINISSSFGVIIIHVSAQNWYITFPRQYE